MKITFVFLCLFLCAVKCFKDPRETCDWYIMPDIDFKQDPNNPVTFAEGEIPVCVRNFVANKQDCRFKADLEFAKKNYNVTFEYSRMIAKGDTRPLKIQEIKPCK